LKFVPIGWEQIKYGQARVVIFLNLKNKMNQNKLLPIPTLLLLLILQACSSNIAVANTPATTKVVLSTATTPPVTPQIDPVPFGSDVNVDQMKFVITGAIRPADEIVSSGDMFNTQPREYQHYIFVTLNVTCEMATDQQCHLSLPNIRLLDSRGVLKYPQWFLSGVEGIFKDTDFQGGTTVSGNVPFIISIGASGLLLIYESLSGDNYYLSLP
jgi:hypothetical protein